MLTSKDWERCDPVLLSELEEDCCQTADCVLEGVTFLVAYLGSCIVNTPSGEETTSQAVKTIVAMVSFHKSSFICSDA